VRRTTEGSAETKEVPAKKKKNDPSSFYFLGIFPYHQFFIENRETDTQGIVLYDSSKIVVAFRGSMTLGDWRINIST
jgi:hypothetical protein